MPTPPKPSPADQLASLLGGRYERDDRDRDVITVAGLDVIEVRLGNVVALPDRLLGKWSDDPSLLAARFRAGEVAA